MECNEKEFRNTTLYINVRDTWVCVSIYMVQIQYYTMQY